MQNSSRGNTVVAAVLLVTLVGAGALTFDSVTSVTNRKALVAEVGTAVERGSGEPTQSATAPATNTAGHQVCQPGFDYMIEFKSGSSIMKPTTSREDRVVAAQDGKGDQCRYGGDGILLNQTTDQIKTCNESWKKCNVFLCQPISMLTKAQLYKSWEIGEGNDTKTACNLLKSCPVGQPCNAGKEVQDQVKTQVQTILRDPNIKPSVAAETKRFLAEAPPEVQQAVTGAFKEEEVTAKDAVLDAQRDYDLKKKIADECGFFAVPVGGCYNNKTNLTEAESVLAERKKYAENLALQSQSLASQQKKLESSAVPPPTGPRAGSEVTACVKDVSGNCVRDARTNPTYTPPATTLGGPDCSKPENRTKSECVTHSGGGGGSGGGAGSGSGGLGSIANLLKPLLGLAQSALGNTQGGAPTCTLTASPKNITQAGQSVTLSWTSQGAQQAQLSNVGNVGPSGSMQVQPQQTTTYTLQVAGTAQNTQQQQQPQGQYVYNPNTGSYVLAQQPQQQTAAQYQYGNCQVQVTIGAQPQTPTEQKPTAQISCQPKVADVGMQVALSFACQNSSVSAGSGFSTNGGLSGNATTSIVSPTLGSNTQTLGLTCSKEGVVDSAQCTVQVNKPAIVLVANPKKVKNGETTNIGWVTGGMESCVISSPTHPEFTSQNAGTTNVSGVAKSPSLIGNAEFVLNCVTKGGGTKSARVTVELE